MRKKIRVFASKTKYEVIYIYNKILYHFKKFKKIQVYSTEITLQKLLNEQKSFCRFGEGEFAWMNQIPQNSFQENSEELSVRLKEVISSNNKNILIGIPDVFENLNQYTSKAKRFWTIYLNKHRHEWEIYLDSNRIYYNTLATRFYIDRLDTAYANKVVNIYKQIWDKKKIVIIEGEYTRLGIQNDLFDNAEEIKRIIAPATNAFFSYEKILEAALSLPKDVLFLLALGPTATVLAYDLSIEGYWAIDVGHIDIEYEWFRCNAREKIPIRGKYVNEALSKGDYSKENISLQLYQKQIIRKII